MAGGEVGPGGGGFQGRRAGGVGLLFFEPVEEVREPRDDRLAELVDGSLSAMDCQ